MVSWGDSAWIFVLLGVFVVAPILVFGIFKLKLQGFFKFKK
jgi:hypothetical protein